MHNVYVVTNVNCYFKNSFKNAITSQKNLPNYNESSMCAMARCPVAVWVVREHGGMVAKRGPPKPNAQCMGKIFLYGMYGTQPNNLKDSNILQTDQPLKICDFLFPLQVNMNVLLFPPPWAEVPLICSFSSIKGVLLDTLQWHSTGLSAWKSPPSPGWLTGVHTLPSIQESF